MTKKEKPKAKLCPKCKGTGSDFIYLCWPCKGTGYLKDHIGSKAGTSSSTGQPVAQIWAEIQYMKGM